ncbi:nucleoside-diphosphate sugar epimerase [Photobacterium aquae]|uniref:Nucleoside-diphosphate sugar epimerase n=1 Tax=Photobacterium aquae TaxID=1195763 RepID=A0A0J1GWC4_9GAMM|nr:NAD(P)H-binding protein [Photobacterium aquae]KLV03916.1 nucleoside-diphosphate sugar epimerase [Photobacterium aquae]
MTGQHAIIAGASGLVGEELIHLLLRNDDINNVYALSRRELPYQSKKLKQILDPSLRINHWEEHDPTPTLGFICLGSTKKQAGSQQALEAVDITLVRDVAKSMKMLGVKHIVVISSLGACRHSPAHYLRCKGKMEKAVTNIGFETCIFVRPGPLKGERHIPRKDELAIQRLSASLHPLMIGPLANFTPIPAEQVAKRMIELAISATRRKLPEVVIVSGRKLLDK